MANKMAETPGQSELPFMCLQYGMEEAAKHSVLDGKFVKVQCVHKSIIEQSPRGPASCSSSGEEPLLSAWPSIARALLSNGRRKRSRFTTAQRTSRCRRLRLQGNEGCWYALVSCVTASLSSPIAAQLSCGCAPVVRAPRDTADLNIARTRALAGGTAVSLADA